MARGWQERSWSMAAGALLVVAALGRPAAARAQVATQASTRAPAQAAARISGVVRDSMGGAPLSGVSVFVDNRLVAFTRSAGQYRVDSLSAGAHILSFRRLGFRPSDVPITLAASESRALDVRVDATPIPIGLVTVVAAARRPQRLLDAPAAITIVEPARMRDLAPFGQLPLLVADLPGVHVQQGGAFEFNLNTRGFNATNNRRMLVLVDGRDVSVPLLGNQEWSDFSLLDEATRVELVRGPASALYGASAFGGVLAVSTPQVRESQGLRASLSGGDPSTVRGDVRYGTVTGDGRWGVRGAAGAMQGASWDRSRTDSLALRREYGALIGSGRAPAPGYELVPLAGQALSGPLGTSSIATGDIKPTDAWYTNARVDRYLDRHGVVTAEGGVSRTERMMSTVSTGRSQTLEATRPWARLAWTDSNATLFAYYNQRSGVDQSLAAPNQVRNTSSTLHIEGQVDHRFANDRLDVTLGASARQTRVVTHGTLLSAEGDGSATEYGALFGQADYAITQTLHLIAAARGDASSRDARQFSPKGAVRWTFAPNQSLRGTFGQGYLVSPPLSRFLEFVAGPPLDLRGLEGGLRASPLGPALQGVPSGTLFTQSAAVPLLALGNADLRPERVSSYEAGYKGQFSRLFLSVDTYVSQLDGFLSQLLPGANPAFAPWTAPSQVPDVARAAVQQAVLSVVGGGLTRRADGSTAYVLSGGNAGRATEHGVEVEARMSLSTRLRLDANYTWYGFSLERGSFLSGDSVLANTPEHSGNVSLTFDDPSGLRARVGVRAAAAFDWRSALWYGPVPASTVVDVVLSRPLRPGLSASIVANNVLDQARYGFFGSSLVRRRVLASLTWMQAGARP